MYPQCLEASIILPLKRSRIGTGHDAVNVRTEAVPRNASEVSFARPPRLYFPSSSSLIVNAADAMIPR